MARYVAPDGRVSHALTIGRWQWDTDDWSLNWRVARTGTRTEYRTLCALRCGQCRRWTLGCDEHWLCGLCRRCKSTLYREDCR